MTRTGRIVARLQRRHKLTDEQYGVAIGVTGGAIRHYKAGRREPKLLVVYRRWEAGDAIAGELLAELMPALRRAIEEAKC